MADRPIQVEGIREVSKALRGIDKDLQKELKAGLKDAAEIVAAAARAKVPVRTGRAAASYKAKGLAKGAAVSFGGNSAPWAPWLDFGGSVGRGHRPGKANSGAVKREIIEGGRYLYPAIAEKSDEVTEKVDQVLADLIRRYDLPTSGNGGTR